MPRLSLFICLLLIGLFPQNLLASEITPVDFTSSSYGIIALIIFIVAYLLVVSEEFLHLRKSKPVIVAAGLIWILVAIAYQIQGQPDFAEHALRANLLEYSELLLFLLSAMTYINTMQERRVFLALRSWLTARKLSLVSIFWLTGILAFFISSVADNLTTALLMCAVILAVAGDNKKFMVLGCINLVVAANAGGAFTPFGDITSLMVWQKDKAQFLDFFRLFFPSLVNWLIPAFCMSFAIPRSNPHASDNHISMATGGGMVIALFAITLILTVLGRQFLHLPPVLGMMTGLGLLKIYGYFIRKKELNMPDDQVTNLPVSDIDETALREHYKPKRRPFDIFTSVKRAEWDTLLFFYGVILSVGGLGALGYLAYASTALYGHFGPTTANIVVGVLSAVVDNIPVMYAVLNMSPDMSLNQWLLVTLTAGVGGSIFSVGSAAGVALMGQASGVYTFFAHLRWTWAIVLGYTASIATHLWLNSL